MATPIGNLEDITLRALRILKEVPLVAAEDTRVTRTLFRAHDIHTPLVSFHEFTSPSRRGRLVERLAEGDVALVTDAGTPGRLRSWLSADPRRARSRPRGRARARRVGASSPRWSPPACRPTPSASSASCRAPAPRARSSSSSTPRATHAGRLRVAAPRGQGTAGPGRGARRRPPGRGRPRADQALRRGLSRHRRGRPSRTSSSTRRAVSSPSSSAVDRRRPEVRVSAPPAGRHPLPRDGPRLRRRPRRGPRPSAQRAGVGALRAGRLRPGDQPRRRSTSPGSSPGRAPASASTRTPPLRHSDADFAEIAALAREPEVVAIGETGLDYYRQFTPPCPSARGARLAPATWPRELRLPVIIHNRQADADIAALLVDVARRASPACCTASARPIPTISNACSTRATTSRSRDRSPSSPRTPCGRWRARVPPDRLLVETDCPYLAPMPHRGQRNEPAFVRDTARAPGRGSWACPSQRLSSSCGQQRCACSPSSRAFARR